MGTVEGGRLSCAETEAGLLGRIESLCSPVVMSP